MSEMIDGRMIKHHNDGHGLNDDLLIYADERLQPMNASHDYDIEIDGSTVAEIRFQRGPRHEADSRHGVTQEALLAVVIDRLEGFQAGPFACEENGVALVKCQEALAVLRSRADARAKRGVLGRNVR